jgi:hypothetical protein
VPWAPKAFSQIRKHSREWTDAHAHASTCVAGRVRVGSGGRPCTLHASQRWRWRKSPRRCTPRSFREEPVVGNAWECNDGLALTRTSRSVRSSVGIYRPSPAAAPFRSVYPAVRRGILGSNGRRLSFPGRRERLTHLGDVRSCNRDRKRRHRENWKGKRGCPPWASACSMRMACACQQIIPID